MKQLLQHGVRGRPVLTTEAVTSGRVVILDRLLLVCGLLILWQIGSGIVGEYGLPAPLTTFREMMDVMTTAWFWENLVATLRALVLAAILSVFGGVSLGAWLGLTPFAGRVAEPILTSIYSLPKITLYPLILLIFGIGFEAKVALGVLHGIIPCTLFTVSAIRAIPPIYLRAGLAMGLSRREIARTILLPAAAPETFTGVRIGLSLTLLGTLIGELFASQAGIGYMLRESMERADAVAITGLTLFLLVFALTLNAGLVWCARLVGLSVPEPVHARSKRPR